jgi:hypothetical protein
VKFAFVLFVKELAVWFEGVLIVALAEKLKLGALLDFATIDSG